MANPEPKAPDAAADAAAPSKPKLPILIGMVAVGLAVGGGTGAAFLGPMMAKKMGKTSPPAAEAEAAPASSEGEHGGGEKPAEGEHGGGGKEGAAAGASVHKLDYLVLKPANCGGSRFQLLTVALEVSGSPVLEQFKTRDAELRDIILTSLSTKTVEQLTDISKREQFKAEIIAAVDAQFGKKTIKRLYFPQFVVQ